VISLIRIRDYVGVGLIITNSNSWYVHWRLELNLWYRYVHSLFHTGDKNVVIFISAPDVYSVNAYQGQ